MAEDGEVLGCERIVSQPFEHAQAMAVAGPGLEVVLDSTYGWYRAATRLRSSAPMYTLRTTLGTTGQSPVKNDGHATKNRAAMLHLGCLAEGWIAPPEVRELRQSMKRVCAAWCVKASHDQLGLIPITGSPPGPGSTGWDFRIPTRLS